ncbi:UbiA family prenyltransferase [Methanosphaerula subterraneus]|uniref:UbiA family prenyltransferase n=1 Tax=Methanosphaerula subterraneus TaxID=3350244 RepID=UPI003F87216F
MHPTVRAYIDLTRIQFFFAWPLLFCSGYLLAAGDAFSWSSLLKAALIGFFGFEAGLVLNDYIDRNYDRRDVETDKLTKYWRVFGTRPIAEGLIPPQHALALFLLLAIITALLVLTLPSPHSLFVLGIMLYSYAVEAFYQVKKRHETYPIAQVIGRTDFALFPAAGYLAAGFPDLNALLYFLFFYPFALAHLGANDLVDLRNDRSRGLQTVTTLYGEQGTSRWILGFTLLNAVTALLFMTRLGTIGRAGLVAGLLLLAVANAVIQRNRTPEGALRALPLFHLTMIVYAGSILLDSVW